MRAEGTRIAVAFYNEFGCDRASITNDIRVSHPREALFLGSLKRQVLSGARMRSPLLCISALALLGPACATTFPTVERNGFQLGASTWGSDERAIRSQASFTTSCPSEQLELQVLSVAGNPKSPSDARGVGVTGCGRKTSWVRLANGAWVINSDGTSAP